MSARAESFTRLHGRWLLIARLAWATVFMTLTAMYALGFLAVRDALSTVCEEELCTLNQQIRHTDVGDQIVGWPGPPIGYADRLRPDQVDTLERLDLTLDQYGWLAALQMGLPVLVYLLIAAGLFWRKSNDWMVLFASVMVATIPVANGLLPFILVVHQPAWGWVFDSATVVALSCFLIFPLIFPTGRFVPRWTCWLALFEIVGAIIITLFSNPILASPRLKSLVIVYLLISFGTGVYAQLYRYFRMASPVERQQLKWVINGLAGFISIAFAVLLPLDALLTFRAAGMDPARALLLSVIPDTIFQVILLFIPVSIAISVLRYRLWDIDIIISRTLVYGALTASVVGLYVLIVGGLGTLFQTQNNLANIVIAILLIAFLFQPLRRRVQDIADGFVPVPLSRSPSAQHENKTAILKREDTADSTLQGHQLLLARVVWVLIALLSISIFILGIVAQYDRIREPCSEVQPEDQANCWPTENALHKLGLTWEELANFYTPIATVAVLPIILIGCAVFWRKSESITGLLFSLGLVTMGSVSANQDLIVDLFHAFPNFRGPITFIHFLSNTAPGMFLCLFPDGRFVPRWTRWLLVLWAADVLAVSVSNFLMPSFGNSLWRQYLDPPGMVLLIVVGIYAFIFRYRYVAGPRQREQIKWIIVAGVVGNIFMIGFKVLGLFWQPGFFDLFVIMLYSPLYYLGVLFAAVCFGISISRYRLWDIELLINRTLVYSALTASVVCLYVLIVGGLGAFLQTQNTLPGIIIALLLIAFLFQPLLRRLQGIADRFVPVPQTVSPLEQHEHKITILKREGAAGIISAWILFSIITCIGLFEAARWLFAEQAQGPWTNVIQNLLWSLIPIVFAFVSAMIISRQPRNMIGWLLIVAPLLFILDGAISLEISRATTAPRLPSLALLLAVWFGSIEWVFMIFPFFLIVLLFPTSAPPSPRWRWVVAYAISLIVFFIAVSTCAEVWPPNPALFPLNWSLVNPIGFIPPDVIEIIFSIWLYLALGLLTVLCVASLYIRYRHAGRVEKKQIQWLLFASGLFFLVLLALGFTQSPFLQNFLFPIVMMGIPASIGIAILRYRLWDIDLIINRTLVYGALTVGIVVLYILVVGALSLVSRTIGNFLISLLATGLIAFLFQPLRERLQRAVNRFMYGERDEPYIVLSQLEQRLETILAPTVILSTTVETIGRALKLPFVEICSSDDQAQSVSFGEPQARTIAFPLAYQNEAIGELRVAPRAGESLSNADQNLLKDLARQIGIAIHAARATADLQRSRERLVLAREEERRRLRRDLHDDLAPTLASLGLMASTVADLIPTNPTTATKLVKELQAEIRATVGNIRRLVYDLRPPTLDELGLLAAVRERAAQYSNASEGFHVTVEAPTELPSLPAAVEVATYRIVQEALENVSKHSQARQCTIRFTNHNGLEIEITDNGIGLPSNITPGIGLRSMRERAEELGGSCVIELCLNGGTRIMAHLPIGEFDGTLARPDRG